MKKLFSWKQSKIGSTNDSEEADFLDEYMNRGDKAGSVAGGLPVERKESELMSSRIGRIVAGITVAGRIVAGITVALGGLSLYSEMVSRSNNSTHPNHSEPINNSQHNISLEQLLVEEGIGMNDLWLKAHPDGTPTEIYYINASVDGEGYWEIIRE